MPQKPAYSQSAICCSCSRPASGRRLRRCPHCNVFYCGRRVCRTFHAAWCSVYAQRSPQPNRDHHARHPCQPNHAITATPPSTPAQSLPTVPTAELIDTADSLAAALQKPVRNPRREAEELLQIRHAWLFPPSSHS
jgi:hypothetical protein